MKILIIEDDENIRNLLDLYLTREGYEVLLAENGILGMAAFKRENPDLILLDVMMPVMDGWQVCREIRLEHTTPIIMISAKGEVFDKVTGLELGADDYISKPLDMREVIARVSAVLRRLSKSESPRIEFANLVIDKSSYDVTVDGKKVDMPPKEIELLYFLALAPNKVFTRGELLDAIWGFDYSGESRTVDVHIKRIREKLDNASKIWSIKTVWSVGYKFETIE